MQLTTDIIYLVSFPHIRSVFFEVIAIIIIKIIPDYNVKQVLASPLPAPARRVAVSWCHDCDHLTHPSFPGKGRQERSSLGRPEEQCPSLAMSGTGEVGARQLHQDCDGPAWSHCCA